MDSLYINFKFKCYLKNNGHAVFETQNGLWQGNAIENLTPLKTIAAKLSQSDGINYVDVLEPSYESSVITVVCRGTKEYINYSRNIMLKEYKQVSCKCIELSDTQVQLLSPSFFDKLAKLSQIYNVEMVVEGNKIEIFGNQDNITVTETETRVLIDAVINRYTIDSIDINVSIIPIIGGPGLINFSEIAKQLNSNIYLPDLLPELYNSGIYANHESFKIWITGSKMADTVTTKKILTNLVANLNKQFLSKTLQVSKEKLDLIVLNKQYELLEMMLEHSSFIQLPKLGSSSNEIIIQGTDDTSVNETINSILKLVNSYYKVWINDKNSANYQRVVALIGHKFNNLVKINLHGMDIVGTNFEIKNFLNLINSNSHTFKTHLSIEIGNDQKDFISGKKNGKMLKILNQVSDSAVIKFLPLTEYNFLISVAIENSVNLNSLLAVIDLLENELPSELQFNVPEIFHKSIIGNGGLIIQSIMKKYNVYIKFSSHNNGSNYFNFKRFNNVLIRCPTKNANKINSAKAEIDDLVFNCCQNNLNHNYLQKNSNNSIYNSIDFALLKAHYLLLTNNFKLANLNNLEIEFQSFVEWPLSYSEFQGTNQKIIGIKGSDIKLKFFINNLVSMLPQNYKFVLPRSLNIGSLLSSERFTENILTPFRILYDIELTIVESMNQVEIWMSYFNGQHLSTAINSLSTFCDVEGVMVLEKLDFTFNPISVDLNSLKFETTKAEKKERKRTFRPLGKITNEV